MYDITKEVITKASKKQLVSLFNANLTVQEIEIEQLRESNEALYQMRDKWTENNTDKIESQQITIDRLEKDMERKDYFINNLDSNVEALQETIQDMSNDRVIINKENKTLINENASLLVQLETEEKEVSKWEARYDNLETENNELEITISNLELENNQLETEKKALYSDLQQMRKRNVLLSADLESKKEDLEKEVLNSKVIGNLAFQYKKLIDNFKEATSEIEISECTTMGLVHDFFNEVSEIVIKDYTK